MKLLVLSDSHGNLNALERAVEMEAPDAVFHLGDYYRDGAALRCRLGQSCPVHQVYGNCDLQPDAPDFAIQTYAGVRIFMTHGHRYRVKSGLLPLCYAAAEARAEVALFGHTHIPLCTMENGIWLLNPGTCYPAGGGTYGLVQIENGTVDCRVRRL